MDVVRVYRNLERLNGPGRRRPALAATDPLRQQSEIDY